jgi:hypothetical protein
MSASAVIVTFCALGLLAAIVFVVGKPLRDAAERRAAGETPAGEQQALAGGRTAERERLEIARETKYREIRDAELDYRTGKLSDRDYRELDAELRGEALVILDSLEAAESDAAVETLPNPPRAGMERLPDPPRAGMERRPDPPRAGMERRPDPPKSTPRDA